MSCTENSRDVVPYSAHGQQNQLLRVCITCLKSVGTLNTSHAMYLFRLSGYALRRQLKALSRAARRLPQALLAALRHASPVLQLSTMGIETEQMGLTTGHETSPQLLLQVQ